MHLGIAATAQYLSLEGGGAGIYPSVNYEHFISDSDSAYSNGLRLKLGLGYFSHAGNSDQTLTLRGGVYAVFGERNNWSAGINIARHYLITNEGANKEGWAWYPNVEFRFGRGWMQGMVGLGPIILVHSGGDLIVPNLFVLPFANVGVAFRLWEK